MAQPADSRQNKLEIKRVFNISRRQLWKAWTNPEMFKQWWGPEGFTCPYSEIDFREGGRYLHCMRAPEGREFWSTGYYQEIKPMEKIVLIDSFSDEMGNVVPPVYYGMSDDLPLEFWIILTFEEKTGNKTQQGLEHLGVTGEDLEDARAGWQQSFDKLENIFKS